MVALGHHGNRPMLLVRLDSELQIYQAYRYPKGHLKLRFKKLDHGIIPGQLKYIYIFFNCSVFIFMICNY